MATYTLRDRGHDLTVETWVEPGRKPNRARLLVDGTEVDQAQADEIGDVRLGRGTSHHTKVSWWWRGRLAGVALVEPGHAEEHRRRIPYAPPPGTRAARLHAWGEAHPRLWAARHVAGWAAGTLVALLGVNVAIRLLTGWISFGWLPDLPALPDLPSIPWPDAPAWWTALWTWVGDTLTRVLDLLLGWVPDEPWVRYAVGLAVAVAVAVGEVRRRERRRREDEAARAATSSRPSAGEED